MADDPALYARRGEDIVCEAGHLVTKPTRDLFVDEPILGSMLEGFEQMQPGDPAAGIEGDMAPPCACGERWCWFGALRFRAGYRAVVDGAVVHLSLQEISADWRDP